MNLDYLRQSHRFEPGRPVYVLLSHDKTHIYSLPNGDPDWSYNQSDMELRVKILKKDLDIHNYSVTTAGHALIEVSNHQAQLEKAWTPTLVTLRKSRNLRERWNTYVAALRRYGAHPLSADQELRTLLKID